MEPINRYSLEDFTERHRADFEVHEPRPELWDLLAAQLDAEAAGRAGVPPMIITAEEANIAPAAEVSRPATPQPVLRSQRRWLRYGVGLALAALVLAAGLGERWKARHAGLEQTLTAARSADADAALYLSDTAPVVAASVGGPGGNARLDTAVHGMERYYATQLADRQAQLSQLAPDAQAEWAQDISGLDSIYRELKRELPQHPQPEVVLTAMNRNLQTRLNILDQQLQVHGSTQLASGMAGAGGEFALADSRSFAEHSPQPHGR